MESFPSFELVFQATLAPPATGKMLKGLFLCYTVMFITCYSIAVSGYHTFGNKSTSNILESFMPVNGPALAPTWVLSLALVFILLQLFAIGLVCNLMYYLIMLYFPSTLSIYSLFDVDTKELVTLNPLPRR